MHQYCWLARWPPSCSSARMDHSELRSRIRLLMASGELPPGGSLADKILPGQVVRVTRVVIGRSMWGPCLICEEADPMLTERSSVFTPPAMLFGAWSATEDDL